MKKTISIIFLLANLSCTPSPPYEVRSPCVSIERTNKDASYNILPCVRKPLYNERSVV